MIFIFEKFTQRDHLHVNNNFDITNNEFDIAANIVVCEQNLSANFRQAPISRWVETSQTIANTRYSTNRQSNLVGNPPNVGCLRLPTVN